MRGEIDLDGENLEISFEQPEINLSIARVSEIFSSSNLADLDEMGYQALKRNIKDGEDAFRLNILAMATIDAKEKGHDIRKVQKVEAKVDSKGSWNFKYYW